MLENTLPPVLLFSFDTVLNKYDWEYGLDLLKKADIPLSKVQPVRGTFKGIQEKSFMLVDPTDQESFKVIGLAFDHLQESILHLDNQRLATFWNIDAVGNVSERVAGRFIGTSPGVARQRGSYTYNPLTTTYYIIQGEK